MLLRKRKTPAGSLSRPCITPEPSKKQQATLTATQTKRVIRDSADNQFTHLPEECASNSCPECKFRQNYAHYITKLGKPRWLRSRVKNGKFGIGCRVCCLLYKMLCREDCKIKQRVNLSFRSYAMHAIRIGKLTNFKRHAKTMAHGRGLCEVKSKATQNIMLLKAPSASTFRTTWDHIRGANTRGRVNHIGGRKKIRRLTWCLAEAIRDQHRAFFRRMGTGAMSIVEDKGQGKNDVRFFASQNTLERRAGILGLDSTAGGHEKLAESTMKILHVFCTPRSGRPKSAFEEAHMKQTHPEPKLDRTLYDMLLNKIGMYTPDGAQEARW